MLNSASRSFRATVFPLAGLSRGLRGVGDAILPGLLGLIQFTIGLFEEFFSIQGVGRFEGGKAEACRNP